MLKQKGGVKLKLLLDQRLRNLRKRLKEQNLEAFLISSTPNVQYLTGWYADKESGFVLVTHKKAVIITDSRYTEHAKSATGQIEIIETNEGLGPVLSDLIRGNSVRSMGFESHHLDFYSVKRIKKYLKGKKVLPVAHMIEDLRSVKEEIEIEILKKVSTITTKSFKSLLGLIRPGMTEKEIAWELTKIMRDRGGEGNAWEPIIVAVGANSSMAHYPPGDRKVKSGDSVLIDFGSILSSYNSDMTRMIFMGKPSEEWSKIYNLVLEAQERAISNVMEGVKVSTLDKKTSSFLEKNWDKKDVYKHSLGHGIGLEVHELPRVSAKSAIKLKAGNVITIEPGIYKPGFGGVRIEDMLLVEKNGHEILTLAPKKINEITV